jgi:hypothetical protein
MKEPNDYESYCLLVESILKMIQEREVTVNEGILLIQNIKPSKPIERLKFME